MLKETEQAALVRAHDDLENVRVTGHDDCVRMARAVEVILAILRADAAEREQGKQEKQAPAENVVEMHKGD